MKEEGFLRALRDDLAGDTTLLVYADWLEDQGDTVSASKAEFLRLTVEQTRPARPKKGRKAIEQRLQQLAATLDTGWLAVVSRLKIESCQGKKADDEYSRVGFDYICDRRWEGLRPTEDNAVRFCEGCSQNVHYCDTIMQAREHAQSGHCIAVDIGVIRRERDLEPEMHVLGMPGPDFYEAERKRLQPDAVSAERERRRREAGG